MPTGITATGMEGFGMVGTGTRGIGILAQWTSSRRTDGENVVEQSQNASAWLFGATAASTGSMNTVAKIASLLNQMPA